MNFELGNLTEEEIKILALATGYSVETIRKTEMAIRANNMVSLDVTIGSKEDGSETTFGDMIADDAPSVEELAIKAEQRKQIDQILHSRLKPREELVIRMRYGFDDGQPKTLEEVGQKFHVTRERIRQVEARALRKLEHYFITQGGGMDGWFL